MNHSIEQSPQRYARIGGVFYLAIIALGLFGETFVRQSLVVSGDPTATINAISASPLLWRAGIVGDLTMQLLDLPVIVVLYLLLRPVSKSLALTATLINLIQTAVLVVNKLNLLVPLFLMGDADYLKAFTPEQLHALSYLAIKMHGYGFGVGLIFFGFVCFIQGYLIYRCGYLPKIFGVLMAIAGLSYLINSYALLLAPSLADLLFPLILVPAFIGELAFALRLTIKGVNLEKWRQRMASTTSNGLT